MHNRLQKSALFFLLLLIFTSPVKAATQYYSDWGLAEDSCVADYPSLGCTTFGGAGYRPWDMEIDAKYIVCVRVSNLAVLPWPEEGGDMCVIPRPDWVTDFSIDGGETRFSPGESFTFSGSVTNIGYVESPAAPAMVILQAPGYATISGVTVPPLSNQETVTYTNEPVAIPPSFPEGEYEIVFIANPFNTQIKEVSRLNNASAAIAIEITAGTPDLVLSLTAEADLSNVNAGQAIELTYQVDNTGDAPFNASVPIIVQLTGMDQNVELAQVSLAHIGGGKSVSGTVTVQLPGELAAGSYTLAGNVNPGQVDPEEPNYTNNSVSLALTISPPDLVLVVTILSPGVLVGSEVTIDYTVRNDGAASFPGTVPVRFLSGGDTIAEAAIQPPEPDNQINGSFIVTVPADAMPGPLDLIGEVNPDRIQPLESNYNNNVTSFALNVNAPDLSIDLTTNLSGDLKPGQDVTITITIRNEGTADYQGAIGGELVLQRAGSDDIILKVFSHEEAAIAEGEMIVFDVTAAIPGSLSSGGHQLITRITRAEGDTNIANNSSPSAVTLDLAQEKPNPGEVDCGNPVSINSGLKKETETDYQGTGPFPLTWMRNYSSSQAIPEGWRFSYSRHLLLTSSNGITSAILVLDTGQRYEFSDIDAQGFSDPDVPGLLVRTNRGFTYLDADGTYHQFDATGKLVLVETLTGFQQSLGYSEGKLIAVTDQFGQSLLVSYDDDDKISQVIFPDGRSVGYRYANGFLSEVILPDNTVESDLDNPRRRYLYESAALPQGLTGIVDENGHRYSNYAYDMQGRAILSSHANNADRFEFSYEEHQTRVTNALGKSSVFVLEEVQGLDQIVRLEGESTINCPAMTSTKSYDERGFVNEQVDKNGNITRLTYTHSSLPADEYSYHVGLVTRRIESAGTLEERTTTIEWHPEHRIPVAVNEAGRRVELTYDDTAQLIQWTEIQTASGSERTWRNTYDANGLLAQIDGPRTDVADITSLAYNSQGKLTSIRNALGHTTQIVAHDANGLPVTVIDPNGLTTHLAYDERLRLRAQRIVSDKGETNTFMEYDDNGNVTVIRLPDGQRLQYRYDLADRLIAIENDLGEAITFTLDSAGNRTGEVTREAGGNIVKRQSRAFDQLSRIISIIGAAAQPTQFDYDNNDNLARVEDALGRQTNLRFDSLDRLISVTDALNGESTFTYDERDNLVEVVDAAGVGTTYTYNGLNNLTSEASTARGTTRYSYDSAGNRSASTDANGITMTYAYDALNRLTHVNYSGAPQDAISYQYDDGDNGIGRLTGTKDASGETRFSYDDRGNLTTDHRVIEDKGYTTHYDYNLANQLVQVIYPSGREVNYELDALSRVSAVNTRANGAAASETVANAFSYLPFGPATSWKHGNGLNTNIAYDEDYRLSSIEVGDLKAIMVLTYEYNDVSNITAIMDRVGDDSQIFGYDSLKRLTVASGGYGDIDYTYDGVGNRLSRSKTNHGATVSETYGYEAGSHRLLNVNTVSEQGTNARDLSYDANGNTISDRSDERSLTLITSARNRLIALQKDGKTVGEYRYNALGQRVVKRAEHRVEMVGHKSKKSKKSKKSNKSNKAEKSTKPGKQQSSWNAGKGRKVKEHLHFHYDQWGNVIAETDRKGRVVREYVYLGNYRIAMVSPEESTKSNHLISTKGRKAGTEKFLYFLHNDHLGTTKKVTDADQQVVWDASQTPFGELDITTEAIRMPMRFPGQYADLETGMSYNYFRDYDPGLGRYLQSDPIGLRGGGNPYLYANSKPLVTIDERGLFGLIGGVVGGVTGGSAAYSSAISAGRSPREAAQFATGAVLLGAALGGIFGPAGVTEAAATGSAIGGTTTLMTSIYLTGTVDPIKQVAAVLAGSVDGAIANALAYSAALKLVQTGTGFALALELGGGLGGAIASGLSQIRNTTQTPFIPDNSRNLFIGNERDDGC